MANTYSQISIHAVFSVKGRENLILKEWRDDLYKYITGLLANESCKSLAVNGWKDHVHIFFGLPVTKSISEVLQSVKGNSSKWINDNRLIKGQFEWQKGFGAFSYARSQRDIVIRYIMNQEEHHKTKSFKEEYLEMLSSFDIEFKNEYLFEFYD